MTVAAVADELDVSARTVLRWIQNGDLEAVKLPGGRLRVSSAVFAKSVQTWRTGIVAPTHVSGPARLSPPGPGTEGELHA
ncbi:MAG: Helix-turn-helix domain [Gaiellales bacterium]|jgi:excisionase family DNA binding protein|nr:Helix-turn-helix domain [Gaiellales bacterium]